MGVQQRSDLEIHSITTSPFHPVKKSIHVIYTATYKYQHYVRNYSGEKSTAQATR